MFHVQKWGNSLGIRIPKAIAVKVGIEDGSEIELHVEDDKIIIKRKTYKLDDMLAQITPDNVHKEVTTGDAKGREVW